MLSNSTNITIVISHKTVGYVTVYVKEYPKLVVTDITEELAKQKILSLISILIKDYDFLSKIKK